MLQTGKIQVYTGNGKGKTTASLGAAIRAIGAGLRVAIIYFDKGGTHYSERRILDTLKKAGEPIEYYATGLDRIDAKGVFRFSTLPADIAEGQRAMQLAHDLMQRTDIPVDVLILDEVLNSVRLKMVEVQQLVDFLQHKRPDMELIITGREVPPEIEPLVDLITEMKLVKHYFYQGQKSREGIEW